MAWVRSPSHRIIGETDDFTGILQRIVNRPDVMGGFAHDARIAAVCVAHGVDARDWNFPLSPGLVTRDPFE